MTDNDHQNATFPFDSNLRNTVCPNAHRKKTLLEGTVAKVVETNTGSVLEKDENDH